MFDSKENKVHIRRTVKLLNEVNVFSVCFGGSLIFILSEVMYQNTFLISKYYGTFQDFAVVLSSK